jgi:methyl-accepting chemotaxis protein
MRRGTLAQRMIRLSLSTKFTIAVLIPLALGVGLLAITLSQFIGGQAERSAETSGQAIADGVSASLRALLDEQMAATRTLRDAVVAARAAGTVSRDGVTLLMRSALEDNPAMLGVWSCWEPNAIDGRDAEFAGKSGNDAHGRYANYVVRHRDGIRSEPLEGYEGDSVLDYYALPKRTLSESVVEPYNYQQDEHWMTLTTFAEPIVIDGKFAGAIGSDIDLAALQQIVSRNRPLGTGRVSLISAAGKWISDTGPDRNGKEIGADDPALAKLVPDLAAGRASVQRAHSAVDGGIDVLRIFVPLSVGRTGTNWSVMVTLPVDALYAEARNFTVIIQVAGLAMAAILCAIIVLCTRWLIGRPLRDIAKGLDHAGSTDAPDPALTRLAARGDEIGLMAGSIRLFQETQIEKRRIEGEAARGAEEAVVAVDHLATGLTALADGDLTVAINAPFSASYEKLRNDFNATVARLRATIGDVAASAVSVGNGTANISRASEQLSSRTKVQATNLEEAAATLDGITKAVNDTAEQARTAKALTESAKTKTEVSIAKVQTAVAKMAAIDESTKKIIGVLETIGGIASQSNLLALNATIEAVHAGEAGQGFAIVAAEVRELAKRSADAAKDINELILGSTTNVKDGIALVDETGAALAEIATEVANAYDAVADIATSAKDQASALQQANAVATELDQVTQHNAAMAIETSGATKVLEDQSQDLLRLTARFRLGEATRSASTSPPRRNHA